MRDNEQISDATLDDIQERLTTGLATCRSVIANYKTLLTEEAAAQDEGQASDVQGADKD